MHRNRQYYDEFSASYDRGRDRGYHALVDEIEFSIIEPYARGRDVLELGCGTGLILQKVAPIAKSAKGIDISPGMLSRARSRGLDVHEGNLLELPFASESFDFVYSLKVLAHIEDLDRALEEAKRVTRVGGTLALEFYNRGSLRYLVKRLSGPRPISDRLDEGDIVTRWDRLEELRARLPDDLELVDARGVRIITPLALVHDVPLLAPLLGKAERRLTQGVFSRFGGFLVVILRRNA